MPMKSEIKKYRLDDMAYISNILEAFCEKYPKKKTVLTGKHGEIDFGQTVISKKKAEILALEGLKVSIVDDFGYKRKTEIAGLPVDINAIRKNTKDYRKGVIVDLTCYGVTSKDLQADIERKERKFIQYLNKYGIPFNRVCVESSLGCEYKFSGLSLTMSDLSTRR
jgi:hypothetical protein